MNNFFTRTVTAVLFVIVIIGSAIWSVWAFAAVFAVFMIAALWEFYTIVNKIYIYPHKLTGIIIASLFYAYILFWVTDIIKAMDYFIYTGAILSIPIYFGLFSKKRKPLKDLGYTYLGLIYIVVPFLLMLVLINKFSGQTGALIFPLFLFFFIWSNDTFAYLAGISLGKHRMCEKISPKKSWEGTIGGLVFTMLLAYILSGYFTFLSMVGWLGLAATVVVSGTFGDLTESMLKRKAEIKDSGNFFPGHGGVFDRFDSFLFAVPAVFIYLKILEII